ncbi:Gfo/Idh/MocA family oxidoreductase [Paenibacillus sp. MER TA 81-3]|uniref:Gfo/Idh/MocA family protein n=1 Tax=Paenibacillus sp. MER TA 81-3 TaxID=2939573 RepID=UPI00203CCB33|nr:Gfo/Idh/MocA family oxidoreductase [Paenibacillus sp. MER TA 81-3]MCM3339787.1 Gfo/Idh/MocA family oxidoreductase [Paenibacillus sp. MER TA 81-3]
MKKRIGIIGLGDIAQKAYLPVLGKHEGIDIAGIMSRTPSTVEKIGQQYRISGKYTDVNELLQLDLDAVFIHTPTDTHENVVTTCLERGVHVYVDKPLSYDINASERMAEAALKHDRLLAVGFNRRFAPMYQEARDWMEEVGGFDLCIVQKHRTRQQSMSADKTLYDDLIHMIDLLLWCGAKPYELASYMQEQDQEGRLLHAAGSVAFSRSMALFSMNRRAGADVERLELHGGGRTAEITNLESAVWNDRNSGQQIRRFSSWDTIGYRRGFEGVVNHFLQSLDNPKHCTIAADRVMDTHQLIEKLIESYKNSQGTI